MKSFSKFLFLIILPTALASAQEFVAEDSGLVARRNKACETLITKHIHTKARAKGIKMEFGFDLQKKDGGTDAKGRPLVEYYTGVFKVAEGYLSDSGASVKVRFTKKSCEIVQDKIAVGSGG